MLSWRNNLNCVINKHDLNYLYKTNKILHFYTSFGRSKLFFKVLAHKQQYMFSFFFIALNLSSHKTGVILYLTPTELNSSSPLNYQIILRPLNIIIKSDKAALNNLTLDAIFSASGCVLFPSFSSPASVVGGKRYLKENA